MKQYDLWLNACGGKDKRLLPLESFSDIYLYQLKVIDNPDYNSYNHYHTTYHVWDKATDKWVFTSVDYRSAYEKYKNYIDMEGK